MKTFAEYYKDLLEWENIAQRELISTWHKDLVVEIEQDYMQAVINAKVKDSFCAIRENSTNQSIGNQVETYAIGELNKFLKVFAIENCLGAGYPDRVLARACYELQFIISTNRLSINIANARKCNPASVSGNRS